MRVCFAGTNSSITLCLYIITVEKIKDFIEPSTSSFIIQCLVEMFTDLVCSKGSNPKFISTNMKISS